MGNPEFLENRINDVTASIESLGKKSEEFFKKNPVACATGMFLIGLGAAFMLVHADQESADRE